MLRSIFSTHIRAQNILKNQISRTYSQTAVASAEKWDLYAGIQLERLPIITKTLTKLERDYKVNFCFYSVLISSKYLSLFIYLLLKFLQELLGQLEFERSYKSNFELQYETDVKMTELIKSGKVQVDFDVVTKLTAQDLKDMWKEEAAKFQLGSRITDADKKNDIRSIQRKLEDPLTLLKEQNFGKDKLFLLPQGKHQKGETLRQTAERVLAELCGNSLNVTFYGNSPCGFYKYKYPKIVRQDAVGAKVFFFRAIYQNGKIEEKTGDFAWLSKEELLNKLEKHENYCKSVKSFIL